MVTTPEAIEGPPEAPERYEAVARNVIAGDTRGAVRRIILYVVMFAAIGAAYTVDQTLMLALICGALLLATDDLV